MKKSTPRREGIGTRDCGWLVPCLAMVWLIAGGAQGQWTTQPVALQPGWNAVYLEVQPEPRACDAALAGLPIDSVWLWNRRFDPVQFIQDPETLAPNDPDWLVWFPPASPSRAATSLHHLLGGRAYLIRLADSAPLTLWTPQGIPSLQRIDWLTDSLNLVGFAVSAQNPPTYGTHFGGSSGHAGQPIYQLNAAGHWVEVTDPQGATLERGQAFWVGSQGASQFRGPIEVDLDQSGVLDFGRTLVEQTIQIRNESSFSRSISVRLLPSAAPPPGPYPPQAGVVALSYFRSNLAIGQYGWVPLLGTLEQLDLAPGAVWAVRLQVRRADMAPPTDPQAVYQSLLEISDDFGTRWTVPVTAQSAQPGAPAGGGGAGGGSPAAPRAGLWLGHATITGVSQPAHPSQPDTPQPVATEFAFRLIVHVDAGGQARLLQKVIQMWKEGTTKPDPVLPGETVVDEPGRYVLLTDEASIAAYSGAGLRDGLPVGRRVSSTAFGFAHPIDLTGSGNFGQNTLTAVVPMAHNDPLNPFVHRYHPDHNNLDERFEQPLPASAESFNITRDLTLAFSPSPPDDWTLAGWGDTQVGGTYRETIRGVHQRPIRIEGYFRLQRASTVASLNDEN